MKYPLEKLLKKADNRYALVQILSQRSRELRDRDESILISNAINQAIDDLIDNKIKYTRYD